MRNKSRLKLRQKSHVYLLLIGLAISHTSYAQDANALIAELPWAFLISLALALILIYPLHTQVVNRRIRDVTQQLQRREEHFRSLIDGAPNAMIMVDEGGRIELVNAQAEALFGYSRHELIDQNIELLVPDRYRAGHSHWRGGYQKAPESRQMGSGRELFARRKDGSEVPVEIGLNPISTDHGIKTISSVIDLSARKRAEDRCKLLVEASPNAIVLVNESGLIELVNSQTEQLFGYARSEMLGESIEMLIPESVRHNHRTVRGRFQADPVARRMGGNQAFFARHSSGKEIPVEVGLAPLRSGDSTLIQAVIIDISERRAAERRMQEQADQLILANRFKSEFLANMSHELRTPLNSIMILSELLKHNEGNHLTPAQIKHAELIYSSGNDLLRLINDILDLSKIEAGRMPMVIEHLNPIELVQNITKIFRVEAQKKHLDFEVDVSADVPISFSSDAHRISQILRNLLSNAIKFTDVGKVKVNLDVIEGETLPSEDTVDQKYLAFTVADTGIGIPEDKKELIFQAFQQVDGSTSRRFGGTGLGLAISRQLAQLLGGTLDIISKRGHGSTFRLCLPLAHNQTEPLPARVSISGPNDGSPILIVEDEMHFALKVIHTANRLGFRTFLVRNGRDAMPLLEQEPFHAMILDIVLPDISGWQIIQDMQKRPDFANIPVHIVSALPKPEHLHFETAGYWVKPVSIPTLESIFLALKPEQAVVGDMENSESEDVEITPPLQSVLLVDDDIRNIYAMSAMLESLGFQVMVARNGKEAITLLEKQWVDIILMDIAMPVMDGYSAIKVIKQERKLSTPVIALTALAMKGDREKCLESGADDYLAKPVDRQTLKQTLSAWLARKNKGERYESE
ncbi:MAG: PAS domain S-box protein [Hahellaceae bacterium]|nr:PAS domain S-box protein [Hahellaceae bacterium]